MPQRRRPTKRKPSGYTATEEDLLNFFKWVLVVSWVCMVIAAIITVNSTLMVYSTIIGIFIAYGIHKRWFKP